MAAFILSFFNIEKAIDADGNFIEPSGAYVEEVVSYLVLTLDFIVTNWPSVSFL